MYHNFIWNVFIILIYTILFINKKPLYINLNLFKFVYLKMEFLVTRPGNQNFSQKKLQSSPRSRDLTMTESQVTWPEMKALRRSRDRGIRFRNSLGKNSPIILPLFFGRPLPSQTNFDIGLGVTKRHWFSEARRNKFAPWVCGKFWAKKESSTNRFFRKR